MMEINNQKNYSRSLFLAIVAVLLLVITVISVSFAMVIYSKQGVIVNTIKTGTLMMTYTEGNTGISITDAFPVSDEAGKKLSNHNEIFKFTVSSKIQGESSIAYEIAAIKKAESTIKDEYVKLYLERSKDGVNYSESFAPSKYIPSTTTSSVGSPAGSMILESGSFSTSETNHYILRMWLNDEVESISSETSSYVVTVNVYGKTK